MCTIVAIRPANELYGDLVETAQYMYLEGEHMSRERKTISDVMNVEQSIKHRKSSKFHKLAPRSVKRDKTKTPDAKKFSKQVKSSKTGYYACE